MTEVKGGVPETQVLNAQDEYYINIMRGLSILRVVLVHLGLSWFYPPYSQYVGIFLPVLFFVSGAVSYYSFLRARSVTEYLIKRLVLIAVPFYVFAILVLAITALFYAEKFPDFKGLLYWVFVWPDFGEVFFPLNQVWFINSLLVMILLSGPIFFLAQRRSWVLWGVIGLSLTLSLLNVEFPLYQAVSELSVLSDIRWGHQAWQTLILIGIFLSGAIHYQYLAGRPVTHYVLMASGFLLLAVTAYFYTEMGFGLKEHTRHRSLYYLFLAWFGIYLLIAVERPFLFVLKRVRVVEWLLLYTNRYAYSIYLLHTLVLFYVERWFGLTDLGDQPLLALFRMFLVLVVTLIVAKPLGDVSRMIAHTIRGKLLDATTRAQVSS